MKSVKALRAALLVSAFSPFTAHAADPASAVPPPVQSTDSDQDVIVTGTRLTGVRAVDSAAPIEVIDANSLARTGKPDLRYDPCQRVHLGLRVASPVGGVLL